MRLATKPLCVLSLLPSLVVCQSPYATPAETLFYMLVNPYRMYWMRNGDTLSQPMHAVSVEAQQWTRSGQGLRVVVRSMPLDVHRTVRTDTFDLTPLGAVRTINGKQPGLNERVDVVPRLPLGTLAAGMSWTDTLSTSERGGPVPKSYRVTRRWHIDRLFDSAGTRWATISANGVTHYQDGWLVDSSSGSFASLDVTGPLTEHVLYSVTERRLLERFWSTNLKGRGSLPTPNGGVDTMDAGLIATDIQRLITPERARLLARPFVGADTTYTYSGGPIFLHVVDRQPTTTAAAMARNDGLIGTAHASFAGRRVSSYDAVWTDTATTPFRQTISVVGESLRIHQTGKADTTVVIPAPWWGIADYAMNELLVPVFLGHSTDTSAAFAIYRPYPGHWDMGTATVRRNGDYFVASFLLGNDTLRTLLLYTSDGELLMGENSDPTGARRIPLPGSARSDRLDAILNRLRKRP